MRVLVHDYAGHPFQMELSKKLGTGSDERDLSSTPQPVASIANLLQPLLHGLDTFWRAHLPQCSEQLLVSLARRLE